jgi:hypothetical protein
MSSVIARSCCVCGASDARVLTDVELTGGVRATLCGSHDLMYRRANVVAGSAGELRAMLRERRGRRDRREERDELGAALNEAFSGSKRVADRRA